MSDTPPEKDNLVDAFHKLGQSLAGTIQAAWDHPERKKVQSEIEEGLSDMSATLKNEVDKLQQSPAGQQLKSDFDEFAERVRSGETSEQLRNELLKALQIANTELEKAASYLRHAGKEESDRTPSEKEE